MKLNTWFYHLNLSLLMKNMKLELKKGMRKFKAFYFIAPLISKNKKYPFIKLNFRINYKISIYKFKSSTLLLNKKKKEYLILKSYFYFF